LLRERDISFNASKRTSWFWKANSSGIPS